MAIESTGYKIITVRSDDGKLRPIDIQGVLDFHRDEHMVKVQSIIIIKMSLNRSAHSVKIISSFY